MVSNDEMKGNVKHGDHVPEIRFLGFEDAWIRKALNEVLNERKVLQKISDDAPILAFAAGQGVIDRSERKSNNRDHLTLDQANKFYKLTEYDDIVYNPSNLKYGAIDRNKHGRGVISPIYVTFTTEEKASFIEHIVKGEKFKLRALVYEEGTVVKRQSVKPENLLSLDVNISLSLNEQTKIGDFFQQIDRLISQHQQKHDKLLNIKKALLEKMFPRSGKTEPEIRFKGFSGDWNSQKLSNLCSLITKQTGFDYSETIKPSLLTQYVDEVYPFLQNKDFDGTTINLNTDFYIPKEVAETFPRIIINTPSILVSISGKIGNVGFYNLPQSAFIGGAVGICKLTLFLESRKENLPVLHKRSDCGSVSLFLRLDNYG
jgi:type I restriction enzyme S subunit